MSGSLDKLNKRLLLLETKLAKHQGLVLLTSALFIPLLIQMDVNITSLPQELFMLPEGVTVDCAQLKSTLRTLSTSSTFSVNLSEQVAVPSQVQLHVPSLLSDQSMSTYVNLIDTTGTISTGVTGASSSAGSLPATSTDVFVPGANLRISDLMQPVQVEIPTTAGNTSILKRAVVSNPVPRQSN